MKNKIIALTLIALLPGCAIINKFQNKGKRETLENADKELSALEADRKLDCETFLTKLRTLHQKVLTELEKVK